MLWAGHCERRRCIKAKSSNFCWCLIYWQSDRNYWEKCWISAEKIHQTDYRSIPSYCLTPSSPAPPPWSAGFFFFCSVECPQLLQLIHFNLGIVTKENTATFCFGCAVADLPTLSCNATFIVFSAVKPRFISNGTIHRRWHFSEWSVKAKTNKKSCFLRPHKRVQL